MSNKKYPNDKTSEELKQQFEKCVPLNTSSVKPVTSRQLIEKEIPAKKLLLSPWLKENETAMIYAPPGTGKTFFALNCAYSLASGSKFLKFIPSIYPIKVLYVDAEMDGRELQDVDGIW